MNEPKKANYYTVMHRAGIERPGAEAMLKMWRTAGMTTLTFRGVKIELPELPKEKK